MYFPPVKEIIQLSRSVLYPPDSNTVPPVTRNGPLSCRTIFVNGLPDKTTEEIVREIFERCGTVETIRMSKKNVCHVRFSYELCVDNAVCLSGYKIKIENKDEDSYTGRLHVDYADTKDDLYEYECKQRSLQCEAQQQEKDSSRLITSPVVHYSGHEASLICENLKSEGTFPQAASVLITWLERGECTKKNSGSFYSMIQSTQNHMRKLQIDKVKYEEQLGDAKRMFKKQLEGIICQFTEIRKIYKSASLQKYWDHFTEAQGKDIEMWKKQTEEFENVLTVNMKKEYEDKEMKVSVDDGSGRGKKTITTNQMKSDLKENYERLQEECAALRCQLEAAEHDIMIMRADHEVEIKIKNEELASMRQNLQNCKKVTNLCHMFPTDEEVIKNLKALKIGRQNNNENACAVLNTGSSCTGVEDEARLICLISTLLHIHPFGANINYICSYLQHIDSSIQAENIQNLMKRFPTLFRENCTDTDAGLERKWCFIGFHM